MSRKTNTIKALVLASAVAGSVIGVSGSASAAGMTVSKIGPLKAALEVAAPVTITGTNFDATLKKVQFGADADCAEPAVVLNATTAYTTVPDHADCVAGLQTVKLLTSADVTLATFTGTATTGITFVAPVDTSTMTFTGTKGIAGTKFKITSAAFPTGATATLGGKPLTLGVYGSGGYATAVPAGLAPGQHPVVVTSETVKSLPSTSTFEVLQAIRTAPVSAPLATPGELVITGLGLKPAAPATVSVTVCGADGTLPAATALKPQTDAKIYVTAPTAAAVETAGRADFATTGGACDVKVTTDVNGATADGVGQVNPVSVLTAGSTFTYTAY